MIRVPAKFGDILLGPIFTEGTQPKTQRIARPQAGYPFNKLLGDYDVLNSKYDDSFFKLPYSERKIYNTENNRPDLISNREYGDTDFWQYILLFNRLADPFVDLFTGRVIRIPLKDDLFTWLTVNLIQQRVVDI